MENIVNDCEDDLRRLPAITASKRRHRLRSCTAAAAAAERHKSSARSLSAGLRLPAHCKALRLRVSQKNGNKQLKQDHVRAINNMRELGACCAVVLCSGGGDWHKHVQGAKRKEKTVCQHRSRWWITWRSIDRDYCATTESDQRREHQKN